MSGAILCRKGSREGGFVWERQVDLSDPWTGFTQFNLLEEKPPDDGCGSGGD